MKNLLLVFVLSAFICSCDKVSEDEQIIVYPNPATTYVIFDVRTTKYANGEITIKDMTGTVVDKLKVADTTQVYWNTRDFSRGSYVYNYTAYKMPTQSGRVELRE